MRTLTLARLLAALLFAAPVVLASPEASAQSMTAADLAVGTNVFVSENLELLRFPDGATKGLPVTPADQLEVMAVKGDLVRLRKGVDMGWAPIAKITRAPAGVETVPAVPAAPAAPTP